MEEKEKKPSKSYKPLDPLEYDKIYNCVKNSLPSDALPQEIIGKVRDMYPEYIGNTRSLEMQRKELNEPKIGGFRSKKQPY